MSYFPPQGIALSCLLDVLATTGRHREALARLSEAVDSGAVRLEDVNRTALARVKAGAEAEGARFPYEVPKKRNSGSGSRASSAQAVST